MRFNYKLTHRKTDLTFAIFRFDYENRFGEVVGL